MTESEKQLFEKVYQNALSILDRSVQTEKNMYKKLVLKEYPKEIIIEVIKKIVSLNLINDYEYTKNAVDYLASKKNFGFKKIFAKLKNKGIASDIIKTVYENFIKSNSDGEDEIIKKFIKKNSKSIGNLYNKNEVQKIRYKLYSNGFSSKSISKAIKELDHLLSD